MQCPECSYISFKIEKACRLCGFRFKKNQKGRSFSTKESFSIFSAPQVKEEKENNFEMVGVLETPEPKSFIDSENGDFELDLPEIKEDEIKEGQTLSLSGKEISADQSLDFKPISSIDLRNLEVEDLELKPFQTTEEEKTEETKSAKTELTDIEETNNSVETASLEPALELTESEEEPPISTEPSLEIPETEREPIIPELDLGDNKGKLDLSYGPTPPNESDPAANVTDLNLKIDDSEGPLTTQTNEIPDIEIKDLGLELESPDESEKDKN